MIVVTSRDPHWLSNSYLVGDRRGGSAVLIDGGTPTAPIHGGVAEFELEPGRLFVTHRHPDHIAHLEEYTQRYSIPTCGHRLEAESCGGFDTELEGGEIFQHGELSVQALHIPGHTAGHLAICVRMGNETALFTGDTLFRHSVGGTRGVGNTGLDDLQHSILQVLLKLPGDTTIYPGHSIPTTVEEELRLNPFVLAWGQEPRPTGQACEVQGQPAKLLLRGPDYDGGTKCWVHWPDGGGCDIVAGSQVVTLTES